MGCRREFYRAQNREDLFLRAAALESHWPRFPFAHLAYFLLQWLWQCTVGLIDKSHISRVASSTPLRWETVRHPLDVNTITIFMSGSYSLWRLRVSIAPCPYTGISPGCSSSASRLDLTVVLLVFLTVMQSLIDIAGMSSQKQKVAAIVGGSRTEKPCGRCYGWMRFSGAPISG